MVTSPVGRLLVGTLGCLPILGVCCAQGDDAAEMTDTQLRESFFSEFIEDDRMDEEMANCVVNYMFANTDRDTLNRLGDAEEVDELSDADIDFLAGGIDACR